MPMSITPLRAAAQATHGHQDTWLCIQILKAESECVHTLLLSTCNAYEHHVSLRAAAQENLWPS